MTAKVHDYYALLGISRTADDEAIRKAFRHLARQFHPDLALDKSAAEEKFKEINEAYEVLSDPKTRRDYDQGEGRFYRPANGPFASRADKTRTRGNRRVSRSENFRPYTETAAFRSFYEECFGGRGERADRPSTFDKDFRSRDGDRSSPRSGRAQRGFDIECAISISLEEALLGAVRTISVTRHRTASSDAERCFLRLRIPPAVRHGQILRLPGQGDSGRAGGEPGDLYLRVHFRPHPIFRVQATHLLFELELTPWEAFRGTQKTIPTMEGPLSVTIHAGTLNGHRLRLQGRGLPHGDGTRGDLLVRVAVKSPLGSLLKKLFRAEPHGVSTAGTR